MEKLTSGKLLKGQPVTVTDREQLLERVRQSSREVLGEQAARVSAYTIRHAFAAHWQEQIRSLTAQVLKPARANEALDAIWCGRSMRRETSFSSLRPRKWVTHPPG